VASRSIGIYLDSNTIIHFVEVRDRGIEHLLRLTDSGAVRLHASEVALAEILVKPLELGNAALIDIYEQFLSVDGAVAVQPVTRAILVSSARNRAGFGNKGIDAIHIASALSAACTVFVSGDKRIRCPEGLERWDVEQLLGWAATQ